IQPGLEVIDRPYGFIHDPPGIQALNRRIREVPVRAIEGEAVIDHQRDKSELHGVNGFSAGPLSDPSTEKDRLPRVRVADPFIEGHATTEVGQVIDLWE